MRLTSLDILRLSTLLVRRVGNSCHDDGVFDFIMATRTFQEASKQIQVRSSDLFGRE
jgi:hypothetical protein